jgi:uncharacterized protein YyaL (SSP411 family)
MLRLHGLTGDKLYLTRALDTLETFAGMVEHFGLYAASYGLALRRAVEPPMQVCVIGDDRLADAMAATAMARFAVNKSVVRLKRSQLQGLPPTLAETLPHLPMGEGSVAVVCQGMSCLPPITSVEELERVLVSE